MTLTRRSSLVMSMVALVALFAIGCGGGGGDQPAAPAPSEAGGGGDTPAATPTPTGGGKQADGSASITGKIVYDGPVPRAAKRPMDMNADPGCAVKHGKPVMPEMLVLGGNNELANVLVSVKSGLSGDAWAVPSEPAVLDQNGCIYIPHVLGVMAGQSIKVLNSDGLMHNVHALPEQNKEFNKAMPASNTETEVVFNKVEEPFKVKCDVHPWMGAWVGVMNHPFFSVTGEDGSFEIKGLEPGTYEIEAWHEILGTQTMSVTVADGEAGSADMTFTPPKRG